MGNDKTEKRTSKRLAEKKLKNLALADQALELTQLPVADEPENSDFEQFIFKCDDRI